jgi:hypothetical protein
MFEDDEYYSDAQIASTYKASPGTLYNWRKFYGFPAGDLFGRLRRTAGRHINKWNANRPRAKAQLASGMGGHGRGRPRKIPAPDLTAA